MYDFKLGLHSSLKISSSPWNFSHDTDSEYLESKMIEFMIKNHGIGLAANQINLQKRVFVMGSEDLVDFPKPLALFNPIILEQSQDLIEDREGCLSYPGIFLKIKRPSWIVGGYQNSKGSYVEQKFKGYAAKCFQHELDHLNGICFVDKVSQLKLQLAMKKLRKRK